MQGYTVSLHLV